MRSNDKPITAAKVRAVLRKAGLRSSAGRPDGYRVRRDGVDGQITVDAKGEAHPDRCVEALRDAGVVATQMGMTVVVEVTRD